MDNSTGKYLQTSDIKIYYEVYGKGVPLIFLHGGYVTGEWNWSLQVNEFSQHFQVFVIDSRGHGKTNNPSGKFSYPLMTKDIIEFIELLQLENPLICGHSDGGMVTMEIAIRYPNLPKAIVLCGVTHLLAVAPKYKEGVKKVFATEDFYQPNIESFKKKFAEKMQNIIAMHGPVYGKGYWQELLTNVWPMWTTPLNYRDEDLQSIKVPVLLIMGDRDEYVAIEDNLELFRKLENVELAIAPNSVHSFMIANPKLFNTMVLDFLLRIK